MEFVHEYYTMKKEGAAYAVPSFFLRLKINLIISINKLFERMLNKKLNLSSFSVV